MNHGLLLNTAAIVFASMMCPQFLRAEEHTLLTEKGSAAKYKDRPGCEAFTAPTDKNEWSVYRITNMDSQCSINIEMARPSRKRSYQWSDDGKFNVVLRKGTSGKDSATSLSHTYYIVPAEPIELIGNKDSKDFQVRSGSMTWSTDQSIQGVHFPSQCKVQGATHKSLTATTEGAGVALDSCSNKIVIDILKVKGGNGGDAQVIKGTTTLTGQAIVRDPQGNPCTIETSDFLSPVVVERTDKKNVKVVTDVKQKFTTPSQWHQFLSHRCPNLKLGFLKEWRPSAAPVQMAADNPPGKPKSPLKNSQKYQPGAPADQRTRDFIQSIEKTLENQPTGAK